MGIYGKLKNSATSLASKASRKSSTAPSQNTGESGPSAESSYAPPTTTDVDADADADANVISNIEPITAVQADAGAASEKLSSPKDNIIGSIIGSGSDGSDNSKKVALLADGDNDPETGEDEAPQIVENKSVISKASSYIKSQLSANNSTIATNTLGMSGDNDYSSMNSSNNVGKAQKSGEEQQTAMEKIMERLMMCTAAVLAFWYSLSKVAQVALLTGAAVGVVGVVALIAFGGRTPAFPAHINVAFVGNSYFYVNDLPRFVQNIGGGHISQDSCLHNSANILNIIMTGNGMYNKWATKKAMINGVKYDRSNGETAYLYDMGACSVTQLLTGHDETITKSNKMGTFMNDGQNPCFQNEAYREYQESFGLKVRGGWDFVVITDQSKNMAIQENREQALTAFNYTYGPILKKKHISPIIVQPHAYSADGADSANINEITTYTALIMEGAKVYKKYLNKRTGWFSKAHIAPVGNAFMTVFEESQNELYPKLFMDDGIHPSAYGTFLYGTIIYATMTGYMPKYNRVVVDNMENSAIFATARRLQASSSAAGFPTKDEAAILYSIAKKVALRGYKPRALRGFKVESGASDVSEENGDDEDFNNAYEGDYDDGQQYYENNYNAYNGYQNGDYQGNYQNQQQQYNGGYGYNNNQYNGGYGENNAAQQYYDGYQQYNGGYGNNNNNQYDGGYGDNNNQYNGEYGNNNNNQYNGGYGNNNQNNGQQQYYYNN